MVDYTLYVFSSLNISAVPTSREILYLAHLPCDFVTKVKQINNQLDLI